MSTFPSTRWSLIILVVVYLPMALTYSLLTRAFEADDEQAHVNYVEYVVAHDAVPHIGMANGRDTHRPAPLLPPHGRLAESPRNPRIHARRRSGSLPRTPTFLTA